MYMLWLAEMKNFRILLPADPRVLSATPTRTFYVTLPVPVPRGVLCVLVRGGSDEMKYTVSLDSCCHPMYVQQQQVSYDLCDLHPWTPGAIRMPISAYAIV